MPTQTDGMEFVIYMASQSYYDAPFFKTLSRNDTGETGGHQGGIVIPRALSVYFPHLALELGPTADHDILAALYDSATLIGIVHARYQIQTWGGERSPEHRLTRNLQPLLERATAGDILRFERRNGVTNEYRITLLHRNSRDHAKVETALHNSRWGTKEGDCPATQADLTAAVESLGNDVNSAFTPFESEDTSTLTVIQRRLRTEAFRFRVQTAYGRLCALCGMGLLTPLYHSEVEAAHIIPRSDNGTNDPRNGIALCRTHHWAFDRFLWTLADDRRVLVPERVSGIPFNRPLLTFRAKSIHEPAEILFRPAEEALRWYRHQTNEAWDSA